VHDAPATRHCEPVPPQTPLLQFFPQQSVSAEQFEPFAWHVGALHLPLLHCPLQQSLAIEQVAPLWPQLVAVGSMHAPEHAKLQHWSIVSHGWPTARQDPPLPPSSPSNVVALPPAHATVTIETTKIPRSHTRTLFMRLSPLTLSTVAMRVPPREAPCLTTDGTK
jgi:hypothetical protein